MKKRYDPFYTPFPISLRLSTYAGQPTPARVLDLACGDGSLLLAASQRWPRASLVGNDVSPKALNTARKRCNLSSVSSFDVLRVAADPGLLRRLRAQWRPDLVLLNPPFSARSRHRFAVYVGTELCAMVSRAAAFLLTSAQLLHSDAKMVAVMPASFLSSARDEVARRLLRQLGRVTVVERLPRKAFPGCRAATIILVFSKGVSAVHRFPAPLPSPAGSEGVVQFVSDVVRGNVRMHEVSTGDWGRRRFLHTTNIREGLACPVLRVVPSDRRTVWGHVVLVPRVGMTKPGKIVAAHFRRRVVLSDCLFALVTASAVEAARIRGAIVENWELLLREYEGTGAPHLKVGALLAMLRACPIGAPARARQLTT